MKNVLNLDKVMLIRVFFILEIMTVTVIFPPCLYKKVYIEIQDQGRINTQIITHDQYEELKRDLKGIAIFK